MCCTVHVYSALHCNAMLWSILQTVMLRHTVMQALQCKSVAQCMCIVYAMQFIVMQYCGGILQTVSVMLRHTVMQALQRKSVAKCMCTVHCIVMRCCGVFQTQENNLSDAEAHCNA